MTPDRWAVITGLFHEALDRQPADRGVFLAKACGQDEALRREVERLLAVEGEPTLPTPVPDLLNSTETLKLHAGDTLGQYRVETKIGEGGMGSVYRAFDPKLNRRVALKVLSASHTDANVRRRLVREARAASALNHPNIITIYEIGSDHEIDFIAMEFVDGKRLDELIPPGGLDCGHVLRLGVQIADALSHAHTAGILHRDLKPSNIMVNADGRVKVLDFSIAKVLQTDGSSPENTLLTEQGMVVGTASYMSPEQAQGLKLDARSDVFSFGIVLYEMATGQRPFLGDSRLSVMNKIVHEDPGEIGGVPPDIAKLILRCLRKDPDRRFQTMADLKAALEDLRTETATRPVHPAARRTLRRFAPYAAALFGIAPFVLWFATRSPELPPQKTVKFTITPANLLRGSDTDIDAEVSISRDGKHIAYVDSTNGQLWVRDIDQEQARPVPGATLVYQAFWSPDNQWVGYSAGRGCGVKSGCDLVKVPVQGGTPFIITRLAGSFKRANWSADGQTIVYCDSTGMYTLPNNGGAVTQIVAHGHIEHPSFLELPDRRRAVLYQAVNPDIRGHGIFVRTLDDNKERLLAVSPSSNPYPAYSTSGHILYVEGNRGLSAIWALPFSLKSLQATGKAFPVAQHGSSPQVSDTGTLVYSDVPSDRKVLTWIDRSGKLLSTVGDPAGQALLALSPDDKKVAVEVREKAGEILIYDLVRGVRTVAASASDGLTLGAWNAAGDDLAYWGSKDGKHGLIAASRLQFEAPGMAPMGWSPDGRFLLYGSATPQTKADTWYRERRTDGTWADPVAFLKTPASEFGARFSPDGRFVTYVSDESGTHEIYVRDFPKGEKKWQISANGGFAPRWRNNEIFYLANRKLMVVPVRQTPEFSPGAPAALFDAPDTQFPLTQYDVTADGKRFLFLRKPGTEPPLSIHVVHNWYEEFRTKK